MSGAKFFTVADTKNGYWHISFDEESKLLTTFNTPWGKYCFERLAFGLTCAGDAFQQQLDQALSGLKGVTGIADDILIWGHTEKDHDETLNQLLQRCKDIGIHLNREKFQYKQRTVKFYGHILTDTGLQADPSKIDAIVKMPPPPACALIQDEKPVCYASRALTEAESRYSNIERELLAAMWSLEHSNHYNEGSNVTLQTDHKPLVSNWSKSINNASPRIQRLLLRMSRYNVKLEYIAGRHNVIADALSRISLRTSKTTTPYRNAISIDEILCTPSRCQQLALNAYVMRPPKMSHFKVLREQLLMVGRKSTKTVLLIYTHSGTSEMNFLLRTNYSSRVTELLFLLHYNPRY